jgi:hypothetical protein
MRSVRDGSDGSDHGVRNLLGREPVGGDASVGDLGV